MSAAGSEENRDPPSNQSEIGHFYPPSNHEPDPKNTETQAEEQNSDNSNNDWPSRHSSESMASDLEMDILNHQLQHGNDQEAHPVGHDGKPVGRRKDSDDSDEEADTDEVWSWGQGLFYKDAIINLVLILLWYLFSVSISVYNKWMFTDGQLNFHFPLFTTAMHMIVQFFLALLVLAIFPQLRPRHDSLDDPDEPPKPIEEPSKPIMTLWFYLTRITPCAMSTGLDIGLGNTSLRFVTLVFFTMCKSSTLGFVLLFAIIFRLEKASWKLAGIILIMTVGVIMMVYGETAFSTLGFILLLMASFFSGLRWSLTQMLLRRNPATSNPFASLFFLTPIMFVTLFILAVPVEGFGPVKAGFDELGEKRGLFLSILILLFPGSLAFLMTSAEFALLKRTSVVTLSVCGIFKEVITITAGTFIFDDTLTKINVSGLLVTISAIVAYNWIRVKKMRRKALRQAQEGTEEEQSMLSTVTGERQAKPRRHRTRMSTGDMIRRSLSISTNVPPRIRTQESMSSRSTLVKLPENVQ